MIMATATSLDGRTFTLEGAAATSLRAGDLVFLTDVTAGAFLGQVLNAAGDGVVLGALDAAGTPDRKGGVPFESANVLGASTDLIEALQAATGAALPVGTWQSNGTEPVAQLCSDDVTHYG
ncbi:hypothetical protein BH09ACT10_BH09ACT10_20110 [soil metagenome]